MITTLQTGAALGPPTLWTGQDSLAGFTYPMLALLALAGLMSFAIAFWARPVSRSNHGVDKARQRPRRAGQIRQGRANRAEHSRIVRAARTPRSPTPPPTRVQLRKNL